MPKIVQSVCHSVAIIGTFASLAVPTETALAQRPSAPVEVTNPTTEPVPTTVVNPATQPALTRSVDDPGRIAYQELRIIPTFECGPLGCGFRTPFSVVPVGHRLVIQHVSFMVQSAETLSYALVTLLVDHAQSHFIAGGFQGTIAADHPVLGYVDGGSSPFLQFQFTSTLTSSFPIGGTMSIMGYLLDCLASPCNPIAGSAQ
jgi:hypothetical protein